MCTPVCALACLLVGTVCRNGGLLNMRILILRPVSGICHIPGILAAWGAGVCWWYYCPPGPYSSVMGI